MAVARAERTAGLARDVLERTRRRARGAVPVPIPDQDGERLSAAFASIERLMRGVSKECENYYGAMAVNKCQENEIKHFCKYHGKSVERKIDSTEEERTEGPVEPSRAQTCRRSPRRPLKDFYIEVSPGIYSVTAISEDAAQTHVVDVNAGQSVDLTFVL
ncbi:A-kinase-interacting protein 1 isoform X3 [Oenanthe melanoleuca]|uniref:A-kinase-interacting protein 1 isoform X3 n=1 Tax=Oenanthe melanoleuca TaxID=2939378 RepID=UPI0024C14183|nr:A-kinase-interacting protein 1 isoform X3 [Oenanthe melanoleuca]